MKPLSLCALALLVASSTSAAVIKVPQDQATLTLAVAAAAAGDTILVKSGVYEENVVVGAALIGLNIKGIGLVVVDARPNGATGSGPGFDIQAVNVTLDNLLIRNPKGTNPNGVFSSAAGTVLNNVRVEHADGAGIAITGNDAFLFKCEVVDSSGGITIAGTNAEVNKTLVHRDSLSGIAIAGSGARVTKSIARAINGTGIAIVGADATIQFNEVRRNADGITVNGTNATVVKNIVDAIFGQGIAISNAAAGTIDKNVITDTRDTCLSIASTCSGLSLNKNDIRRCGSNGSAAVVVDGDNNTFNNNLVRESAGDGVFVSGDNNTLFKDTSSEHGEDGFQFTGIGNSANKCIARNNQGEGAQCDAATNSLTNSILQANRIDVAASVPFATFTGNVFTTGGNATAPEIDD